MDLSDEPRAAAASHRYWACLIGGLAPAIIPPIHIAIFYVYFSPYNMDVDRHSCHCSCWDTVFKGPYETGTATYKHLYFNATSSTLKIWIMTVVCIIALYECIRHLLLLHFTQSLRTPMFVLFATSLYSQYFSWWVFFNYINDDFNDQWNHQMFFTITELISTGLIFHLTDLRHSFSSRKALGIIGIAVMHVLAGGLDQFVFDDLLRGGASHKVIRQYCLMIPDILQVVLPLRELRMMKKFDLEFRKDVLGMVVGISVGLVICHCL